jgi:hypothetical protein
MALGTRNCEIESLESLKRLNRTVMGRSQLAICQLVDASAGHAKMAVGCLCRAALADRPEKHFEGPQYLLRSI